MIYFFFSLLCKYKKKIIVYVNDFEVNVYVICDFFISFFENVFSVCVLIFFIVCFLLLIIIVK